MAASSSGMPASTIFILPLLWAAAAASSGLIESVCHQGTRGSTIHGYSLQPLDADEPVVPLSRYAGKVLLLINVATY